MLRKFIAWFKNEWNLYIREFCEVVYGVLSIMSTVWAFILLMESTKYVVKTSNGSIYYYLWYVAAVVWLWFSITVWRKFTKFLKR